MNVSYKPFSFGENVDIVATVEIRIRILIIIMYLEFDNSEVRSWEPNVQFALKIPAMMPQIANGLLL